MFFSFVTSNFPNLSHKPHQCWFIRLFPFLSPLPLPFLWVIPTYLYHIITYLTLTTPNDPLARINLECWNFAEPKHLASVTQPLLSGEMSVFWFWWQSQHYLLGKIHHRCQTPHQHRRNLRVWDGGYWKGTTQSKPAYLLFYFEMTKLHYLYF